MTSLLQALVAQENEVPPPTGLTSVRNTELIAPPIYHDTSEEQLRAEGYLQVKKITNHVVTGSVIRGPDGLLVFFKKKMEKSLPLFVYFRSFQKTIQFLQQINAKKCHSSTQRRDSNPWPLKYELSSITTSPGVCYLYVFSWQYLIDQRTFQFVTRGHCN